MRWVPNLMIFLRKRWSKSVCYKPCSFLQVVSQITTSSWSVLGDQGEDELNPTLEKRSLALALPCFAFP